MNDYILETLKNRLSKYKSVPIKNNRLDGLRFRSYYEWTVKEVLKNIEEDNEVPVSMVVEEFIDKMDLYSCLNSSTSLMFSVAKDTAEFILDLVLSIECN